MAINPQNAATLRSNLPLGRMYYTAPTITLRGTTVVVQHPAQTLAAQHRSASISWRPFRQDQPVAQSLVVPFVMIMRTNSWILLRNASFPNQIIRSRHDSLMLRTNLSA